MKHTWNQQVVQHSPLFLGQQLSKRSGELTRARRTCMATIFSKIPVQSRTLVFERTARAAAQRLVHQT